LSDVATKNDLRELEARLESSLKSTIINTMIALTAIYGGITAVAITVLTLVFKKVI
jgi:hypothetical protein